jgi:Uma2 family endonuclease
MSAVLEYPQRHPVTAEEYLRMGEAGVFAPDSRLELIEGEIVEMAPIGSPHAGPVNRLLQLLGRAAGDLAIVSVQNPLIVGDRSVPQPDVALLKPRTDSYTRSHPRVADVLLVVEVADTTLAFDLGTKVPLYAKAGIFETWVVDLQERSLRVFRDPSASGDRASFTVSGKDEVSVDALPAVRVAVAALFPP